MITFKQGVSLMALSLFAMNTQLGAEEHQHEQHESHVHGEASMMVVVEQNAFEIEFRSPAMNILGFEHQANNDKQQQTIANAIRLLKQPKDLFNIPADAKCKLESVMVDSPFEHQHEPLSADEENEHRDFSAHYHYQCQNIKRLQQIKIIIFEQFPGTEAIEVQSISARGQQKSELTLEHNQLDL